MKEGRGILGEVKKKTVWGNHFGINYYIGIPYGDGKSILYKHPYWRSIWDT